MTDSSNRWAGRGAGVELLWSALMVVMVLAPATSSGRVRYLSTSGVDDPDAGSSPATGWRSFPFALSQLQPGDVLMVEPGTWTWTDGGVFDADCTGAVRSGVPDAGITVRATAERQARIVSNGARPALGLNGCAHWNVEGLFVEGGDFVGGTSTVLVNASPNVALRRLLVSKDNRYGNSMTIDVRTSSDLLLEECEVYDYFQIGVAILNSPRATLRRCYANPRGREPLDGGYPRNTPGRAEQSYSLETSAPLVENSVSEGARAGFFFFTNGLADDGRYFGDLSVRDFYGTLFQSAVDGVNGERNRVQDFVAFQPDVFGMYWKDTRDSRCDGCTVFESSGGGLSTAKDRPSSTQLSVFSSRTLVTGLDGGFGFEIVGQDSFGLSDVNAFGFATPYSPATGPQLQRATTLDPGLGRCPVMIPESSPMKRAAADGGDIGANLLYRYHDGALTTEPLWSPGFPCGAIVPGVNDVPGASCFDLHLRLGIEHCAFPKGYLPDGGPGGDAGVPDAGDGGVPDGGAGPLEWNVAVGCGCQSGGPSAALALLGCALLLNRSRRRAVR